MTSATFGLGPAASSELPPSGFDGVARPELLPARHESQPVRLLESQPGRHESQPVRLLDERQNSVEAGLAWRAYQDHFAAVWRTLRRLGVGESDVDDALQDVFLTVQRRAHEFRAESQLKTWVLGIAVRVALNARRGAQRRRLRFLELSEEPAFPGAAPDDLSAEREAIATVHELLGRLAPEQRVLIVLVDLEQLNVPEAAELLGLNASTTYKRLEVARTRFSAELERAKRRDEWRLR